MADTEIQVAGVPGSLSVSVRVRSLTDLAILETVAMTWSVDHYTGDVTGAHDGTFVFEILIAGQPAEQRIETIADDDGPYPIVGGLQDNMSATLASIKSTVEDTNTKVTAFDTSAIMAALAAIQAKTDLIGNVTFLIASHLPDSRGTINIKAGDTHNFVFTSDTEDPFPDFTGKTVRFGIRDANGNQIVNTTTVTILSPTGFQSVQVDLLPALTLSLEGISAFYDVQVEYAADDIRTIFTGDVKVDRDHSGTA